MRPYVAEEDHARAVRLVACGTVYAMWHGQFEATLVDPVQRHLRSGLISLDGVFYWSQEVFTEEEHVKRLLTN